MDLSNKALALLLVMVAIVSLTGTIVSLNRLNGLSNPIIYDKAAAGMSTFEQGSTNLTIQQQVSITFRENNTNFGTGYVSDTGPGIQNCSLNTSFGGSFPSPCINFSTGPINNLTIENDGNVNANVTIAFDKNATTFITGTTPSFQFLMDNNETASCLNFTVTASPGTNVNVSTEVNSTGGPTYFARNCNYVDATDTFKIAFYLRVPEDANPGTRTTTINATASA